MKSIVIIILVIHAFTSTQAQVVSEKDKATILRIKEEEKMARDIYLTLNEKWYQKVFTNISESEFYHLAQMDLLVKKYLPAEVKEDKVGVFLNIGFMTMYNDLTESGRSSLEAAFKAGAQVEETDIMDLQKAIGETEIADIKATYQYLVNGSKNHLRAFARNLSRLGIVYKPILLTEKEYNTIIAGN